MIPREFDIKPSSHPSWGKLSFLYYTLCTWSLNLTHFILTQVTTSRAIKTVFWLRCRGIIAVKVYPMVSHNKVNFITNLCEHLSLGRLHLREHHLIHLYLQTNLFCFVIVLHIIFIFRFHILFSVLHFVLHLLFRFALFSVILFSVLHKKIKNT